MAQTVKNLAAMQETWVPSLGREDPLEKGMATHSSILAWRSPWTEEPGGLQSMGLQRVGHDWATFTLPSGPVVKTHASNVRDMGSISGQGTKIAHASWQKKKKIIVAWRLGLRRAHGGCLDCWRYSFSWFGLWLQRFSVMIQIYM